MDLKNCFCIKTYFLLYKLSDIDVMFMSNTISGANLITLSDLTSKNS